MKKLLIALCLSAIFAGCTTPKQALYDAEVDSLCKRDAGVIVYETVYLGAESFDKNGFLKTTAASNFEDILGPAYLYRKDTRPLRGAQGASGAVVMRHHSQIIRKYDSKVLGESLYFSRYGGDFIGGFQPSSHGCPPVIGLTSAVFKKVSSK